MAQGVALPEFLVAAQDYVLNLTLDSVHRLLFLTRHFPVFFVLQTAWVCIILRRFAAQFSWRKSFATAGFMALFGRVLVGFVTHRRPPLFETPMYVVVFVLIWFLMNCSPFDIVHRILSLPPFLLLMQAAYAAIQVRECCHGVDIGLRAYPTSAVGAVIVSIILSSTECFIWLLVAEGVREFSSVVILRNIATACAFFAITQYPELWPPGVPTDRLTVKMLALGGYLAVAFLDQVVFRLRGKGGLDVTLLSLVGLVFRYRGQ